VTRNGQVVDLRERGGRVPPHDLQAEESILGAMLISREAVGIGVDRLMPDQFYKTGHGHIFHAIRDLHRDDQPVDPVTVADKLRRMQLLDAAGGHLALAKLQGATSATTAGPVKRYARVISEHHTLRCMISVAGEIAELGYRIPDDVGEAIGQVEQLYKGLAELQRKDLPDGYSTLDAFLGRAEEQGEDFAPWLIPGLLKRDWRTILIGQPGSGKSLLLQMVAVAAAGGHHPFNGSYLDKPLSTLIVDLENPEERVESGTRPLRDAALESQAWEEENCHLWHQRQGIDLTRRHHQADLEAVVRDCAPDLVVIGPAYKMAPMRGADSNDVVARVLDFMDGLRIDYGFALMMETHPPRGDGPMRAFGSAQWEMAPEISITMNEVDPVDGARCFELGRARGDRVSNEWPTMIRHRHPAGRKAGGDGLWPWVAVASDDPEAF
jgi:hypothetical protein